MVMPAGVKDHTADVSRQQRMKTDPVGLKISGTSQGDFSLLFLSKV